MVCSRAKTSFCLATSQDRGVLDRQLQLLMIAKCTCNNCSAHLEFDSQNAGTIATCPECGMETRLYVPTTPKPPSTAAEKPKFSPPQVTQLARELGDIRARSSYKTLRTVIDVIFLVAKILVGLAAATSAVGAFEAHVGSSSTTWQAVALALTACAVGAVVVVLLHAAHQAAVLLIDIADCSIRLVTAQESKAPTAA
jgi:hypothetical protein